MRWPEPAELAALEARVERALAAGGAGDLVVLGYGEISAVIRLESGGRPFACKRLPPFPDAARLAAYRACLDDSLLALAASGVRVAPTTLIDLARPVGRFVAYAVQPELPGEALLPAVLARASEAEAVTLFGRLLDAVAGAVGPRLGLDAQVSNWAVVDGALTYLDVTTPMLRDLSGAERLDTDLFIASLPWALRGLVRRFLLGAILDKYYLPRGAVLDAVANLVKEGLERLLPALAAAAGARFPPPIDVTEARRTYAGDARMWQLLQALRRLDRRWHRSRGRVYPFLLPGQVDRRV